MEGNPLLFIVFWWITLNLRAALLLAVLIGLLIGLALGAV